jgi:hypothetical protein
MGFGFGEVLAHVNYMLRRGALRPLEIGQSAQGIQGVRGIHGTQRVTVA